MHFSTGIGGLEEHVLKTATLSTDIACPAFRELQLMAVPILRVAVEPTKPLDLPAVVRGLKLLNQADACVQVCFLLEFWQEHGESYEKDQLVEAKFYYVIFTT